MSVLADEDQDADRPPSQTIKRAPISRRIKEAERAEPPFESQELKRSPSHASKIDNDFEQLLTPKEASRFLRVSQSWLAKARMRGDGPPYMTFGRSIRYCTGGLVRWMKSCVRRSTSQR